MTSSRQRRISDRSLQSLIVLLAVMLACPLASALPDFSGTTTQPSVEAGQTFPIIANLSSDFEIYEVLLYLYPSTGQDTIEIMALVSGNVTSGVWSYDVQAPSWKGYVEYHVTARDSEGASRYPSAGEARIEVVGDTPPKEFPWGIVLMVAFLGAALVLTELAFKPGLYRKTGREKARELEEEDRKPEEESNNPDRQG